MTIRIGSLRHRVSIQKKSEEQSPLTGSMKNAGWVDVFTRVPASIEDLMGRELIAAQAISSKISSRIVIRWCQLDASYRVNHNGKIYNIEAPLNDSNSGRETITLLVSSGVNQGG